MKSPAVLDTNVASYVFARRPEADLYLNELEDRRLALSFQTVAEMLHGAELKSWGKKRRRELTAFLDTYGTVFADANTLHVWARMRARMNRDGHALSFPDSWVAATALAADCTLIAHDAAFRFVPGLDLICHAPA